MRQGAIYAERHWCVVEPNYRYLEVEVFIRCTTRSTMALHCEKVLRALHYLFHCAPARREFHVGQVWYISCHFVGIVGWKTCQQWREPLNFSQIITYVDQVKAKKLPNPRSTSQDTVADTWMDHFFMSVSRSSQPFLVKYQTDAQMIPFLSKDLEDLIRVGLMTTTNVLKWFSHSSIINQRRQTIKQNNEFSAC